MGQAWKRPIHFADPDQNLHHMIRSTEGALTFLTEQWRWKRSPPYIYALTCCRLAAEGGGDHDMARDEFVMALICSAHLEVRNLN